MSTTDNNGTASGSDNLRAFWIALRLTGGALGVLTLLKLATIGLGVEYKVFFQELLNRLNDLIELAPLLDPIEKYVVHPTLDWFRNFGWAIPPLGEHWRLVFSLTSLVTLAMMRHVRLGVKGGVGVVWFLFCSLVAAVASGTMPLNSVAIGAWPLAALLIAMAGLWVPIMASDHPKAGDELTNLLMALAGGAFFVFLGSTINAPAMSILLIFLSSQLQVSSPGMLDWAALVSVIGMLLLAGGFLFGGQHKWTNSATATGLDITGVMGTALFVGWLMLA